MMWNCQNCGTQCRQPRAQGCEFCGWKPGGNDALCHHRKLGRPGLVCGVPREEFTSWSNNADDVTCLLCRAVTEASAEVKAEVIAATMEWTDADQPIPEDEAIQAAHPTRTGNHALYAEAMRLVGAKRSKYALVDLVNWLLSNKKQ